MNEPCLLATTTTTTTTITASTASTAAAAAVVCNVRRHAADTLMHMSSGDQCY